MGDYNRNSNRGGGGGGRFGGRDSFRRDSGPREMHKAVCDKCGKNCEVPFRPSGDKPIYCSECFEGKDGGNSRSPARRDSGRSDFGRRDDSGKQLLEQVSSINSKLERILKVLEGNTGEKKPAEVKQVEKVEKKVEKATPIQEVIVEKKKEIKKEAKKSTPKA